MKELYVGLAIYTGMALAKDLLKEGAIESRVYQETILANAVKKNTLVVLPTGLGKTFVAAMLAAKRLEEFPYSKILFLAPTKPLVEQHCSTWKGTFNLIEEEFNVFTGQVPPEKRGSLYKDSTFIFATPQVIQNDLISKELALDEVSLLIVDEAHRTSGEYPYEYIAKQFNNQAESPRILALTASPGSNREEIEGICKKLFIENVEARHREDSDVRPYVKSRAFEWIQIELPKEFYKAKLLLERTLHSRLDVLKKEGLLPSSDVKRLRKRDLLELQAKMASHASENPDAYGYLSVVAAAFKLYHCIELLETQGIAPTRTYLEKLRKDNSKAAKNLFKNYDFQTVVAIVNSLHNAGEGHPKLGKLLGLLKEGEKSIVFAHYRSSVDAIIKMLEKEGIRATKLIGQAGTAGISQKEQVARLQKFREGKYQVLVATSVGEEGLDIPSVDRVVFYEPVPSAIRSIQRGGRTARARPGKVSVLVTKGTRDEAYYWASRRKEDSMRSALKGVSVVKAQRTLDKYSEEGGVVVFADTRESSSGILKKLSELGLTVRIKQLDVADFQLSGRVGVERKKAEDFVQSLIDGRLFSQAKRMGEVFEKPLMIVEGPSLYGLRNVNPNAIRGGLAAIAIDFGITILRTDDVDDTAAVLAMIARREQGEKKSEVQLRGERKPASLPDLQQYIVESLPGVGPGLAKRLLKELDSVEKVMTAPEGKLKKVEKIGEKKAKEIRRVLSSKYTT